MVFLVKIAQVLLVMQCAFASGTTDEPLLSLRDDRGDSSASPIVIEDGDNCRGEGRYDLRTVIDLFSKTGWRDGLPLHGMLIDIYRIEHGKELRSLQEKDLAHFVDIVSYNRWSCHKSFEQMQLHYLGGMLSQIGSTLILAEQLDARKESVWASKAYAYVESNFLKGLSCRKGASVRCGFLQCNYTFLARGEVLVDEACFQILNSLYGCLKENVRMYTVIKAWSAELGVVIDQALKNAAENIESQRARMHFLIETLGGFPPDCERINSRVEKNNFLAFCAEGLKEIPPLCPVENSDQRITSPSGVQKIAKLGNSLFSWEKDMIESAFQHKKGRLWLQALQSLPSAPLLQSLIRSLQEVEEDEELERPQKRRKADEGEAVAGIDE